MINLQIHIVTTGGRRDAKLDRLTDCETSLLSGGFGSLATWGCVLTVATATVVVGRATGVRVVVATVPVVVASEA